MIFRIIYNSFRTDIKFIVRDPMLLISFLAPVLIILLLKLAFPLISILIDRKTGIVSDNYYSVVAITFVSVIPMLLGMVYAFMVLDENDQHILQAISVTPAGRKNFLLMRMTLPAILSLLFCGITIALAQPVPTEGWLRNVFITLLLALQAPFIFLFIASLSDNKIQGLALTKLYGIFLMAAPLGLLLHHPWNYLAFFSPFYWIAWSWVIRLPNESLGYGIIAIILTFTGIIILLRHFLRKHVS